MSFPTLSFDCSQEKFDALKAQLQTEGITIAANVGQTDCPWDDASCPGPADDATVTSLTLRAVPNSFSLIRPIPGGAPYDWKSNQRLFHWCRMPCTEMKDLEAIHSRYGERRRTPGAPVSERRRMPTGWLQARAAYVMQVHRLNCAVCRADI